MLYKCLIFLMISSAVFAQTKSVVGFVIDEKSGEPLSAANLQIVGTYHGTITNIYGEFFLTVEEFPVEIEISYIGYAIKRITVEKDAQKPINILLKPVILETEAIVVTAENPAMHIMRRVIENKQKWRAKLKTFKANAYARVVLGNDSSIVSVAESISDLYWNKEKGAREVVLSQRETENLKGQTNFAFSVNIENFYDDEINIMNYRIVGPTHPDAFDFYEFKLKGIEAFGQDTVFVIDLAPIAVLNPTFIGTVSVLDKEFAMLAVDVVPNPETIFFPMPMEELNVAYKQQFRNFGKEYWLPVDLRAVGDIKISFPGLDFPRINYSNSIRITDYQVNVDLPDSLYEDEKIIRVDSVAVALDSSFTRRKEIIPLTSEEQVAYVEIDSTDSFEKAFRPTGFLADYVLDDEDENDNKKTIGLGGEIIKGFSPDLGYNRVEEGHLGFSYERTFAKKIELRFGLAYKTGIERWGYNYGLEYDFGKKNPVTVSADYFIGSGTNYESENYHPIITSIGTLFGAKDYYDYYWKRAANFKISHRIWDMRTRFTGLLNIEQHESMPKNISHYNVFDRDVTKRQNPFADRGKLNSLGLKIHWGNRYVPFGVAGQKRVELSIEHSDPDILDSDFSFTQYKLGVNWNFRTFLQRRFLPNTLDLYFSAGYSDGELPLQKLGVLDASLFAGFTPFGSFKANRGLPYIGEKYMALFWEHNFRSVPFELLGGRWFAKNNIGIIVFSSHGRSWLSDENKDKLNYINNNLDDIHHEIGVSLNGLFKFFRIDVTWRLDRPGTYLGVSTLRWF
ncbi:MAG: carboxypeptidase-like regulatory domain-containing protein [Calditrichaeota bacterium]|nr:MAG: carboxypeptidase-like regulatory domain-containing protein [Calditrichota bacterium]MBL1207789.1 carboxypeptidase-like regulatory domain-containing protein [Calditrichota bacterium]NOG47623.1 carboxypeptidase-like regulatory domain-containing protein [Calditrichota bacterium]